MNSRSRTVFERLPSNYERMERTFQRLEKISWFIAGVSFATMIFSIAFSASVIASH